MKEQTTIYILFEDEDIRLVFAELLQALGTRTEIVVSTTGLPADATVVTEPCYYQNLLPLQKVKSLTIGNKTALQNIPTPTLSRPLTEEKIEAALDILLGNL